MARMATGLDTPGLLTYYGPTLLCMTLFEKGIDTLEWLLPANWTRKLSPETGADQEIGSEACCSDLLSVNQRRLSDDGRRDIVLGIETFTGLQSKVVQVVTGLALTFSMACLCALVVLKYMLSDHIYWTDNTYSDTSLAVASACLLTLVVRGGIFMSRILSNVKQGNFWPHRRKRVMVLAYTALLVQIVNLLCWLAPNAYLVAVPCRWNGWNENVINAFGALRWTCWNTHLMIFLIQAHDLCAWTSSAARVCNQQPNPLVMDAPWTVHLWKLPGWLLFEAVLVSFVAVEPLGKHDTSAAGCGPSGDSPIPQTLPPCEMLANRWGTISMAAMFLVYFLVYLGFLMVGFHQLHSRPSGSLRMAVILFRLQARSTFLAHQAMSLSSTMLWFSSSPKGQCNSLSYLWWGILPAQIVATFLVWGNCWYFMPSAADEDPVLQVYLQEFAWTEAGKPAAVARRAEHAQHAEERLLLAKEPMFCFQTAVALHRWSCLTYLEVEHVVVAGAGKEDGRAAQQDSTPQAKDAALAFSQAGVASASAAGSAALQPPGRVLRGVASFVGIKSDGLVDGDSVSEERRSSGSTATTSYADSEAGSASTEDPAAGTGKARPGAGRRRRAGKHTPEDVQATLDAAMSLYGLHSFRLFWDQGLDIRALLSWSHDSAVLAFRGTASLTNACSDLKIWMSPHPPKRGVSLLGTCPKLHTGFLKAWTANGLHTDVIQHLQDLVASGQLCKGARLLVTGHSLGGALATLAAFDIKQAMAQFRVQLYTFGTPYPGNRAFSREFNDLLPDTWHVIHDGDAVTRTGKLFVAKRPGERVIVDQSGQMRVRPNCLELQLQGKRKVNPHYLESYRTALQAAMLLQFGRLGTPQARAGVLALAQDPALRAILAAEGVDWEAMQEAHLQGKVLPKHKGGKRDRKRPLESQDENRGWLQHLGLRKGSSAGSELASGQGSGSA